MPKTKIKRVSLDELEALVDISRRTFTETFAAHNTDADMQLYLQRHMTEGNLKAELEDPQSEFYFVTVDGGVAGYMKLKYNSGVEGLDETTNVEIERIYILEQFQQSGLGRKLMDKVVTLARDAGFDAVWLGVWEHNANAIAFYRYLGFTPFGKQPFVLGNDLQTDIRMRLKLGDIW